MRWRAMAVEMRLERDLRLCSVDIREEILKKIPSDRVAAVILADEEGIIAGMPFAEKEAGKLGLSLGRIVDDGGHVRKGEEIIRFSGGPKQIVLKEEILVGLLAKPSGIATFVH